MNEAELDAWLRLAHCISSGKARELLKHYGLPQDILALSATALGKHLNAEQLAALHKPNDQALTTAKNWLQQHPGFIITLADDDYPKRLLEISDPPILLYGLGRRELLNAPRAIAVVGSRNASEQGLRDAAAFAKNLSQAGIVVISGLALGIDAAAHRGGLEGSGSTIAVLGTGIDRVYPASHKELAVQIAKQGLLLSEFALTTPPITHHFPRRNRIISGLSEGVLVVEAALQSGSLITARVASEQGREVFAIPGSIHSPMAKGCHQLIKQGAKLVDDVRDIQAEMQWQTSTVNQTKPANHTSQPAAPESALLQALGWAPISSEDLASRTQIPAAQLATELLELELDGHIIRLPSGLFQRVSS